MAFAASAFVRANSSAAALDIPGSKRSVGDRRWAPESLFHDLVPVQSVLGSYRVGVIQ
jgi:hypothetical protein